MPIIFGCIHSNVLIFSLKARIHKCNKNHINIYKCKLPFYILTHHLIKIFHYYLNFNHLCSYHGFKNKVLPDLEVKLQRETAKKYQKLLGEKTGQAYYRMRYGILISFISAAKASWRNKSASMFIDIARGYIASATKSEKRIVTRKEGKYIRKYRRKGMLSHFGL